MPVFEGLKPRLRPLEAFPIESNGRRLVCLRDPMNISDRVVGLPGRTLLIVSLMDGTRTLADIQVEYLKQFSEILPTDDLERLVSDLDASLMLDSPHFREHVSHLERDYHEAPVRPPSHIGSGYEGEPAVLSGQIDGFFSAEGGPGGRNGKRNGSLAGVIAPHIDFGRGGATYAWAYRELLAASGAEVFVVLGTSHMPLSRYFSVTRKDFATPFGVVHTHGAFVDELEGRAGQPLESDPLVHRGEHSVELQAVWLSYLFAERPVTIVPILCGSLGKMVEYGGAPTDEPEVAAFLEALRATLRSFGQRALLIAAADLAHVGTGFGDERPPDDALMRWVEEADRESLAACERMDAAAFFAGIQQERDRRRICGLSPIYAMLSTIDAREGKLLQYRQCVDPAGFRNVTIASAAFYR